MAKVYDIEKDTPIMPAVIAGCVLDELQGFLHERGQAQIPQAKVDEFEVYLVGKQADLYQHNPSWRKKMRARGNKGRDTLYAFMRHWLAAEVGRHLPVVYRGIERAAPRWCVGEPLPRLEVRS